MILKAHVNDTDAQLCIDRIMDSLASKENMILNADQSKDESSQVFAKVVQKAGIELQTIYCIGLFS